MPYHAYYLLAVDPNALKYPGSCNYARDTREQGLQTRKIEL